MIGFQLIGMEWNSFFQMEDSFVFLHEYKNYGKFCEQLNSYDVLGETLKNWKEHSKIATEDMEGS